MIDILIGLVRMLKISETGRLDARTQMIATLKEFLPALELARADSAVRFDPVETAKFTNAASSFACQYQVWSGLGGTESSRFEELGTRAATMTQELGSKSLGPEDAQRFFGMAIGAIAFLEKN